MSKSDPSDLSRINMKDDKDIMISKIQKAKTDTKPLPSDEKNLKDRPEVENLLGIYSSLTNQTLIKSVDEFAGKNFSEFKNKLAEVVVEKISPISYEVQKLENDPEHIDKILISGAEKAEKIARKKVEELKKIVGF